jgi:catechol 2,3-dioxygenase-like lactoylglutathione lyase family enzyme
MDAVTHLIGVELIVEDLDRAVELFTGVLGLEVVSAGPSATVVGRMAVVDAGPIAVTLLEPASAGPGHVLAERSPRLSQLVFGVADVDSAAVLLDGVMEAGLAAQVTGPGTFYVSPESVAGALGQRTAVVVTPLVAGPPGPGDTEPTTLDRP